MFSDTWPSLLFSKGDTQDNNCSQIGICLGMAGLKPLGVRGGEAPPGGVFFKPRLTITLVVADSLRLIMSSPFRKMVSPKTNVAVLKFMASSIE